MKVTFGIINCNRLHYLRSCCESLLASLENTIVDWEMIVIDNASIEENTLEYLSSLEINNKVCVFKFDKRDPSNEFARGLNKLIELSSGELICPLQGDTQFVIVGDWLKYYVEFFQKFHDAIGCIAIDAQRRETIRNEMHSLQEVHCNSVFPFVVNSSRPPVAGAGDVFYRKALIEKIGGWSENNLHHEGGQDSETEFLRRVAAKQATGEISTNLLHVQPIFPVACCIYTDPRGTNARVRGNRRYGQYWPAKESFTYYKMSPMWSTPRIHVGIPNSIEQVAIPIGFDAPLDAQGMWKKNPIRPETANASDYVNLIPDEVIVSHDDESSDDPVAKWLFGV